MHLRYKLSKLRRAILTLIDVEIIFFIYDLRILFFAQLIFFVKMSNENSKIKFLIDELNHIVLFNLFINIDKFFKINAMRKLRLFNV